MLPIELRALISEVAADWSFLQDPRKASGKCADYSYRFELLATAVGLRVESIQCEYPLFTWDTDEVRYQDHVVNIHNGIIIDWTARQFWRGCIFPWIQPIQQFQWKWLHITDAWGESLKVGRQVA